MVEQARDKWVSSWFNAIPLEEQGLSLNKEQFKDTIRLRYDLPLSGLQSHCTFLDSGKGSSNKYVTVVGVGCHQV